MLLLLMACGGGGGSSSGSMSNVMPNSVTPDPPPSAADFESPEYKNAWQLAAVNAAGAYARLAAHPRLAAHRAAEPSALAPGSGVNIGMVDTGILRSHPEFQGAQPSNKILFLDLFRLLPLLSDVGVYGSHGTVISSVIMAQPGTGISSMPENNFHGVAWGVDLKMFAIPLGSGDDNDYTPINLATSGGSFDRDMSIIFDSVLDPDENIDIINMSFGVNGLVENYQEADLRMYLDDSIDKAAQTDRTAADKTLIVISAGNHNGHRCASGTDNCNTSGGIEATSPALWAGLPAHIPELRSHVVTAVATERGGEIASFSNRCGIAAQWCIAAPGHNVLAAGFTLEDRTAQPRYRPASGTSLSAPMVAGGLAIIKDYYRDELGAHEILQRLYVTANREGQASPDDPDEYGGVCPAHLNTDDDRSNCELSSTHGWGIMDLDAALRPVGMMAIVSGNTLDDSTRIPVSSNHLQTGAALGNTISGNLRGHQITVFDELDAPFQVDLGDFIQHTATIEPGERLHNFMQPKPELTEHGEVRIFTTPGLTGGLVDMPFAATRLYIGLNQASWELNHLAGHASLTQLSKGGAAMTLGDGAFRFSAFTTTPELSYNGTIPTRTAGTLFSWAPQGSFLKVRLGTVREFERALGTEARGAFGSLSSELTFTGIGLQADFGGWHWQADAELGVSNPDSSPGMIRGISRLSTSAFSVSGSHVLDGGGQIRLSLAQPLRVEKGQLQLRTPTGRDRQRNVIHKTGNVSLAPAGQQLDFTAEWHRPMQTIGGELRLGTVVSLQPGHVVNRGPEFMLMAGYRVSF